MLEFPLAQMLTLQHYIADAHSDDKLLKRLASGLMACRDAQTFWAPLLT